MKNKQLIDRDKIKEMYCMIYFMSSDFLLTLCCFITGLSAPNNNSAVTLLNAAKPSIGRYYMIVNILKLVNLNFTKKKFRSVTLLSMLTSLFSPLSIIRFSAYKSKSSRFESESQIEQQEQKQVQ